MLLQLVGKPSIRELVRNQLPYSNNDANQAVDPAKRRHLEEAMKQFKLEAEQREKSLQQMQAREGELSSQLQTEQADVEMLRRVQVVDGNGQVEDIMGGSHWCPLLENGQRIGAETEPQGFQPDDAGRRDVP